VTMNAMVIFDTVLICITCIYYSYLLIAHPSTHCIRSISDTRLTEMVVVKWVPLSPPEFRKLSSLLYPAVRSRL